MSSYKLTALVCVLLFLLGLVVTSSAGVFPRIVAAQQNISSGTDSVRQTVTSYGAVSLSKPNYLVFQNSTANYLENKQGQIIMSSSDPTAVINAAIGNATSGNTIVIDSGTYVLSNPIGASVSTSAENVVLTFATGAIITVPANFGTGLSGYMAIMTLHDLTGWTIQGGEINGNAANQNYPVTDPAVSGSHQMGTGIFMGSLANCIIQNMFVHDVRIFGIMTWGCSGCKILNNHITGCGANGITTEDDTLVQGNLIEHCNDVGISIYGTNCQVINNTCQNGGYPSAGWSGANHIAFGGIATEGPSTNDFIEDNTIINPGTGINIGGDIATNTYQTIKNNTITGASIDGMIIYQPGGNNNTITGNIISTTSSTTGGVIDIGTDNSNSGYNTITGNTLNGVGISPGIWIYPNSNYNNCTGNTYVNCASNRNYGTGNTF
jgi:parallel beta-helix repeat protein